MGKIKFPLIITLVIVFALAFASVVLASSEPTPEACANLEGWQVDPGTKLDARNPCEGTMVVSDVQAILSDPMTWEQLLADPDLVDEDRVVQRQFTIWFAADESELVMTTNWNDSGVQSGKVGLNFNPDHPLDLQALRSFAFTVDLNHPYVGSTYNNGIHIIGSGRDIADLIESNNWDSGSFWLLPDMVPPEDVLILSNTQYEAWKTGNGLSAPSDKDTSDKNTEGDLEVTHVTVPRWIITTLIVLVVIFVIVALVVLVIFLIRRIRGTSSQAAID